MGFKVMQVHVFSFLSDCCSCYLRKKNKRRSLYLVSVSHFAYFCSEPLISFVVSEMEISYSGYFKGSKLHQSLLAPCGQRVITEIVICLFIYLLHIADS